jgi:DNA processing protein
MPEDSIEAALTLNMIPGLGSRSFLALKEALGSADAVLKASGATLRKVPGIREELVKRIVELRDSLNVGQEIELAQKLGARIIPFWSEEYPEQLRQIHSPPIVLYVKGEIRKTDALAVAIVGARHCSLYGRNQAEQIAFQLAARGFCIVSGMARGTDAAAHEGALKAGGRTIAVLGAGLANIYPREHKELAEKIAANGALVSELPMATPVDGRNFPPRNRIISGLSLGVAVIEAAGKSGSLITAKWAQEQNRDVFALPGKIDNPLSLGPHRLIRDGARIITCVEDILDQLGQVGKIMDDSGAQQMLFDAQVEGLNDRERQIFEVLEKDEAKSIDDLADELKLPVSEVSSTLTVLQIRKVVKDIGGRNFIRL